MIDSLQMALERERTARMFLEQQLNQMREMYQNGLSTAVTPASSSPSQQRQQQLPQQPQPTPIVNSAPKLTPTTITVHDSVIRPTPLIAPISGERETLHVHMLMFHQTFFFNYLAAFFTPSTFMAVIEVVPNKHIEHLITKLPYINSFHGFIISIL
ncbi:unnamed protein product [Cylicostephanus goldi]|uniref:Uncharacterized protein n=1 Tax=Cylicostephanus goldi TaxID=71465 RepID=A0A3P6TXW9_CYLGO|nr:unnamed protein product [Cylicostephanus goldi]